MDVALKGQDNGGGHCSSSFVNNYKERLDFYCLCYFSP